MTRHLTARPDWLEPLHTFSKSRELWTSLCDIASHQYLQTSSDTVVRNLQFLTPNPSRAPALDGDLGDIGDPFGDCCCATLSPFSVADYSNQDKHELLLTDEGAMAGCIHYVALSYCWKQSGASGDAHFTFNSSPGYHIKTKDGLRDARTPANVLSRAIMYAAAQGFRLIWIDQECIDQDDEAKMEESIQAMHPIYRRAQQTVALLNNPIVEQKHLDVFDAIGCSGPRKPHSSAIPRWWRPEARLYHLRDSLDFYRSGVELAEMLVDDPWFTRAWTLQETMVSGGPLHFLVPYRDHLSPPSWMSSVPQQLIVSETVFDVCFNYAFFNLLRSAAKKGDDFKELHIRGQATQRKLCMIPDYKLSGTVAKNPEQARLSAASACGALSDRCITKESDLIAILGNLCQYRIRLNSVDLHKSDQKFPLCAFALSLLNGDLSLFLGLEASCQVAWPRDVGWTLSRRMHGFSLADAFAIGDRPALTLSHNDNPICRVWPPKITNTGLVVSGTLWTVTSQLGFQDIQARFARRWKERNYDILCEIFWAILEDMEESNFGTLAMGCLMSSHFRTMPLNPSPAVERLWKSLQQLDSLPPAPVGTKNVWWLVERVMEEGSLLLLEMGASCTKHGAVFILHAGDVGSLYMLTLRRVLVMDEMISGAPHFLLSFWVSRSGPEPANDLKMLDSPFKVSADGLGLGPGSSLLCGDSRHFCSCSGEEYVLLE